MRRNFHKFWWIYLGKQGGKVKRIHEMSRISCRWWKKENSKSKIELNSLLLQLQRHVSTHDELFLFGPTQPTKCKTSGQSRGFTVQNEKLVF